MKNLKKKGFTIVELVIVIAVIAILSAVLIPTFSNLIKKANLSNDQSFVRNANTTLAVEGALEKFENAGEAINALNRNGFSGKYNTYSSGFHYCYSLENNKMYLVDDNNVVIYPEEVELSSLWGLYMNDRTSYTNGITKYVALDNVTNSQHYLDIFKDSSYTIDLNGHFIAIENNTLDVTVNNGIIINGANEGEAVSSEYTVVDADITGTGNLDLSYYCEEKDNQYILSKLIFTSSELGKSINPHYYNKEVVFEDCIFYDVAVSLNDSTPQPNASSKFINCKFIDITDGWSIITYSTIEIDNCLFTNLTYRGAIQVQEYNNNINVKIVNCTFDGTASDYPLIRLVYGNVSGIKSLEISNCEFSTLNKGKGIIGMKDDQVSLYNWSGQDGEATILFENNVLGKDIPANKYVYNAGSGCKLAELFAASVK